MTIVITNLASGHAGRHPAHERRYRPPPAEPGPEYTASALRDAVSVGALRSEQQRAEVGALNQALQAAETAAGLAERAASGVEDIHRWLGVLYESVSRSLEDPAGEALEARTREIAEVLRKIDRVARGTRFGTHTLLDGGLGAEGAVTGEGLALVSTSPRARSSPPEGYPVVVHAPPGRATLRSERPLGPELLRRPLRFHIREGPRSAETETRGGETFEQVVAVLSRFIDQGGLELLVEGGADHRIVLKHVRYGPGHSFQAASSAPGILSSPDGKPVTAEDGSDIAGTLNGEPALGKGEVLIGKPDNRNTAGLAVAFTGTLPRPPPVEAVLDGAIDGVTDSTGDSIGTDASEGIEVGRVMVAQSGMTYRFGPAPHQAATLYLPSLCTERLGRRVYNRSGFGALAEIQVDSIRQGRDALRIVERATEEVAQVREELAQLRRERIVPNLAELRVRSQNLAAGQSAIADAGFAHRLAEHVSDRLWSDGGLAARAQTNPVPGAVMKLIN